MPLVTLLKMHEYNVGCEIAPPPPQDCDRFKSFSKRTLLAVAHSLMRGYRLFAASKRHRNCDRRCRWCHKCDCKINGKPEREGERERGGAQLGKEQ